MTSARLSTGSPLGPLRLTARNGALVSLDVDAREPEEESDDPLLREAAAQLAAYFAGRLQVFDLPLAADGSPYQKQVWAALSAIPYGETRTYGEIAAAIGSNARAVGFGCGSNPIPIVVPCHRVLAAGGALGGFSAGEGVVSKRLLLDLEGALPEDPAARQGDLFAPAP